MKKVKEFFAYFWREELTSNRSVAQQVANGFLLFVEASFWLAGVTLWLTVIGAITGLLLSKYWTLWAVGMYAVSLFAYENGKKWATKEPEQIRRKKPVTI